MQKRFKRVSKKPTVKAQSIATFSRSARANIGELHYTKWGALTSEDLTSLALSALTQVLTLRRYVDLTVVAATLS